MTIPSSGADHEVHAGRRAEVGGLPIVRVLPAAGRRTIGAWCFVDLMGPDDAIRPDPMEVGPHPHIGLSTVTWLLTGDALHRDSLGTEQPIRPGQLNLMTAGRGIAHSELSTPNTAFRGVQLWVAQPDTTRHGEAAFEHHGELPETSVPGAVARVLVGGVGDAVSDARTDTPMMGAELTGEGGLVELRLEPSFEHAVVPLDGPVGFDDDAADHGDLLYLPPGRDHLELSVERGHRLMLLGGEPFGVRLKMWWNFVGRDLDELTTAWRDWRDRDDERFGPPPGDMERIEAPVPPWLAPGTR